jgi:hypothetical protein
MVDRLRTRHETPDELPRFASSDHPLGMSRRTPGPAGLAGKIALAALGLILMFAATIAIWAAVEVSRRDDIIPPNARLEQR